MRADAKNSEGFSINKYIKVMIVGILSGTIAIVAVFLITSLIMVRLHFPLALVTIMSTIAGALGSFVASFVVCKIIRKKGMLVGLLCGLVLCFIIFLACSIFFEVSLGIGAFSKFVAIIVSSVIGGIMGVNSKRK